MKTRITVAVSIMSGNFLANGDGSEDAECDILSLAKELTIVGTVVLKMKR